MQKRDEGMVVLTVCVGRYGYISLSGFPTTFIIDMALSAPRLTYLYKYNALITNVYLTKIG